MQFRRRMPPLHEWRLPRWKLPRLADINREQALRWAFWLFVAGLTGYLIAALFVFPAPLIPRHQVVPRVLGLPLTEARRDIAAARLGTIDNGSEPHYSAPMGTVIWQDPPPGLEAPPNLRVALIVSAGPPRVAVPDVAGLDVELARSLIVAAGLTVGQVETVQAAVPTGLAMATRPPAATTVAPGSRVALVVSRGAPTISVPDLMGLSAEDARVRLEAAGLELGGVTRRRTPVTAPGTIIAQRPASATLAAPGTLVEIVVARSP